MYHQSSLKLLGDIIIHSAKNAYPPKQSNFLSVITLLLPTSINGFFTWQELVRAHQLVDLTYITRNVARPEQ